VNPDLTFEFGPVKDGKRDFVVSAAGIKDAFPAVEAVVAARPPLARWNVIAFRPRRHPVMEVRLGGYTVKPSDVQYQLFADGSKVGIVLCFPGLSSASEKAFKQIGYLLLDEALGELDVETKVGFIEIEGHGSKHCDPALNVSQLARDFDVAYARQGGAAAK
jgi:hypothetical protein